MAETGERIGAYEVVRLIARGGMATVYEIGFALQAPICYAAFRDLRNHPVVDGYPVSLLKANGFDTALPRRHFFVFCPQFVYFFSSLYVNLLVYHVDSSLCP